MAAYPTNQPGNGVGISGPANAQAKPRPMPNQAKGAQDGPTESELRAAWAAYNGTFSATNDGLLTPMPGVPDLNVKSNRIRPVVNVGVDFLFGPLLTISTQDATAQKILDATWGDDDLRMTLLSKAAINGGVYGHVFFKVVPPKKGRAAAINPPRLVLLNPETLSIETDPDDADLVLRFCIEYATTAPDGSPLRKKQTITRVDPDGDDDTVESGMDTDTRWLIQNWEARGMSGAGWQQIGPDVPWSYEFPPIVDWQNFPNPNSHWGQRDVTDSLVALNKQLRLVESNINKIGYLQGHPYLYAVGATTSGLKPTPGQIIDLEGENAKIAAVNAAGDLGQLMAFADQLRSDMDEESGIPGVALGRLKDLPRGAISGITMRLLNASALARNEHKRRLYGQGIRQICQTVLVLCGWTQEKATALDIKLAWQDPLPSDDLAEAQAWQAKLALGYSQTTAIEETGGNPELEADRKADEQQAQVTAFSQGKGMPPMPPTANMPPDAPGGDSDGAAGQDGTSQGATGNNGQMPPTNHPAAIMARQRVKAAFGKA